MKFECKIQTYSVAFEDNPIEELHKIFNGMHDKIARGVTSGALYDSNGNMVGAYEIEVEK